MRPLLVPYRSPGSKKAFAASPQRLAIHGAPGWIRTSGLRIRSPALYPLSYGRIVTWFRPGHQLFYHIPLPRSTGTSLAVSSDCDNVTL